MSKLTRGQCLETIEACDGDVIPLLMLARRWRVDADAVEAMLCDFVNSQVWRPDLVRANGPSVNDKTDIEA